MYHFRSPSMSAFCGICMIIMTCGIMVHSPALAETTMEEICGACQAEIFVKGPNGEAGNRPLLLKNPPLDSETFWIDEESIDLFR